MGGRGAEETHGGNVCRLAYLDVEVLGRRQVSKMTSKRWK